ncbi:MAG TPA: hypothetical protein VJK48_00745 [Chlamydiales bacterium]|nr:hypothetical protein [Chlamydiales bacterium]
MDLTSKAKQSNPGGRVLECGEQEQDLMLSYLRGEINAKQMCGVLGIGGAHYSAWASCAASWIIPRLKKILKEKKWEIVEKTS